MIAVMAAALVFVQLFSSVGSRPTHGHVSHPLTGEMAPPPGDARRAIVRLLAQRHIAVDSAQVHDVEVASGPKRTWWTAGFAEPSHRYGGFVVARLTDQRWRMVWCGTDWRSCSSWMPHDIFAQLFPNLTTDWAGYCISSGRFKSVRATWTQPSVAAAFKHHVAIWVGLDGSTGKVLEQIGTDSCEGACVAFYELFPAPPHYGHVSILPGDRITAQVVYLGSHRFRLTLEDQAGGLIYSIVGTDVRASCASAEIIVEGHETGHGLAPFTAIRFEDCTVDGQPLGIWDATRCEMCTEKERLETCTSPVVSDGLAFAVSRQ